MTDFEKACQKLPENGPNSKLSKCQVFEISYKANELDEHNHQKSI